MTTPIHGADVQALRQTAQAMCDTAEELIATDLRIAGALSTLTWNGPDAMRARLAWDTEHGPALYRSAKTLVAAGEQLLREADDQEQTSAGGGLPDRPAPGAVGVAVRSTLAAELFSMNRVLGALTPSAQTVDRIREGIGVLGFLDTANSVYRQIPVPPGVSSVLGYVGVADDVYTLGTSLQEGDTAGAVRSGGSLMFTGAATYFPVHGAVAEASWYAGWEIGEAANTAMAGTRFEQNYRERNEVILDMIGDWGLLVTPGTLIVAGAQTAGEALGDAVRSWTAGDDAGGPGVGGP